MRVHGDANPIAAVGGTLALAGVALSAALLRLTGVQRKRVRRMAGARIARTFAPARLRAAHRPWALGRRQVQRQAWSDARGASG